MQREAKSAGHVLTYWQQTETGWQKREAAAEAG